MNARNHATIVVGVDGSEAADHAVEWAMEEAKARGARVRVVTAWHVPAAVYGAPGVTPPIAGINDSFRDAAAAIAEEAAERVRRSGLTAETRVEEGQPAEVLVSAAEGADVLVVGSRGHGGFTGLLLGSVSAQCVRHAPCPVLVVR